MPVESVPLRYPSIPIRRRQLNGAYVNASQYDDDDSDEKVSRLQLDDINKMSVELMPREVKDAPNSKHSKMSYTAYTPSIVSEPAFVFHRSKYRSNESLGDNQEQSGNDDDDESAATPLFSKRESTSTAV